jgi:hypothetical protein
MKKLLLLAVIILLPGVAKSAQEVTTGVTGKGFKLGFTIASINTAYDELNDFLDSRVGFTGGAFLTYNLSRQFAVQPEILYAYKGAEKNIFFVDPYWFTDYLEFPVLLKYDLVPAGPFHPNLFVGPAISVLLKSEVGYSDRSLDVSDGTKSLDVGLVFGGGIDYKRVTLDVRYTLGLANTIDADKVNGISGEEPGDNLYLEGDPSVKNRNLSFMIGVRL